MSKSDPSIDWQAIEILLSALEAPQAVLSSFAFSSLESQVRGQLVESGLVRPDGYEAVGISNHDDESLVTLSWSAEHQGYGYFSPMAGWVTARDQDIARYAIDFPSLLAALTKKIQFSRQPRP